MSKTKFIIANDLHIGSYYQDNPNAWKELLDLTHDQKTILLGDIFDLSCCKNKDVERLSNLMNKQMEKFGDHYIMGNHERNGVNLFPLKKTLKSGQVVGFAHGDLIYKPQKWIKYRKKAHGASWIKLLFTRIFTHFDFIKGIRPLPDEFINHAYEYCIFNNLDILVCGHFHPDSQHEVFINNKRLIVLPAHKINEVWL